MSQRALYKHVYIPSLSTEIGRQYLQQYQQFTINAKFDNNIMVDFKKNLPEKCWLAKKKKPYVTWMVSNNLDYIRKMPNASTCTCTCSITLVEPRLIYPFGRPCQIPVPYVNLLHIRETVKVHLNSPSRWRIF